VQGLAASPDAILLALKTRAVSSLPRHVWQPRRPFACERVDRKVRSLKQVPEPGHLRDVYAYQATPPINGHWSPALKWLSGLYVKFTLLPEHVLLVSFHPLEQPIPYRPRKEGDAMKKLRCAQCGKGNNPSGGEPGQARMVQDNGGRGSCLTSRSPHVIAAARVAERAPEPGLDGVLETGYTAELVPACLPNTRQASWSC